MDPIRISLAALHIGTSGRLGRAAGVNGASLTDGGVLKPISQDSLNGQVFDLDQNFACHGFRYLLVNGYDDVNKDNIECYNTHSETILTGNFTSSSVVLNQIQHNILWSQLSNSMSLPTDCPQWNERRGWMGDAGLSVDETLYNFDYVNFYLNFLTIIKDNRQADGAISDTVPFTGGFSPADPNWGTAYVTITWALYDHTGDITIIEKYYSSIQAWVNCLTNEYEKSGLARMYFHWRDWSTVQATSNTSQVSSYAFLHDVYRFVKMSLLLNRTGDFQQYTQLYQRLAAEFHQVFYNSAVSGYVDSSQTMNILALALPDMVPQPIRAAVLNSLINNLVTTGYFTGGIVSICALHPLLSNEGHHDLALKLSLSTSYPSYGYMFYNDIQNATTTWEVWDALPDEAQASLNHHMFNSIGSWFYRYLVGIEINGLRTIRIHPRMSYESDLLTHVQAEVRSIKGAIRVEWTRASPSTVTLSVMILNNLAAIVSFDPLMDKGRCMKLMCDETLVAERSDEDGSYEWSQK